MTEPAQGVEDTEDPELEPLYPDVQSWVENLYVVTFIRVDNQQLRWCASWWAHPEAIIRLSALWQTWEIARLVVGTGMADWLRNNLDSLAPVLHSGSGPFASCTPDKHSDQKPMPVTKPAAGYWDQTVLE